MCPPSAAGAEDARASEREVWEEKSQWLPGAETGPAAASLLAVKSKGARKSNRPGGFMVAELPFDTRARTAATFSRGGAAIAECKTTASHKPIMAADTSIRFCLSLPMESIGSPGVGVCIVRPERHRVGMRLKAPVSVKSYSAIGFSALRQVRDGRYINAPREAPFTHLGVGSGRRRRQPAASPHGALSQAHVGGGRQADARTHHRAGVC